MSCGPVPRVVADFGYLAGGWRVDRHPRSLADTTGDCRADIGGFGDPGGYGCRGQADGEVGPVARVVDDVGYNVGGGRVERAVAQCPRHVDAGIAESDDVRTTVTCGFRQEPRMPIDPPSSDALGEVVDDTRDRPVRPIGSCQRDIHARLAESDDVGPAVPGGVREEP